MSWQPIETAPKNGKHVLLYAHWVHEVHEGYWRKAGDGSDRGWRLCFNASEHALVWGAPSHWQPLPDPPAVSENPLIDVSRIGNDAPAVNAKPQPLPASSESGA